MGRDAGCPALRAGRHDAWRAGGARARAAADRVPARGVGRLAQVLGDVPRQPEALHPLWRNDVAAERRVAVAVDADRPWRTWAHDRVPVRGVCGGRVKHTHTGDYLGASICSRCQAEIDELESREASVADKLNSWARETGVEEARTPADCRELVDRLWSRLSAEINHLRAILAARDAIGRKVWRATTTFRQNTPAAAYYQCDLCLRMWATVDTPRHDADCPMVDAPIEWRA